VARSNSSRKREAKATNARAFVAPGPLPVPRELLSAGVELDPDIEIARQRRMEALKADLVGMLQRGDGARAIDQVMSLMLNLERDNERLAWRVLRASRYRFGSSSEKLSRDELMQLFLALGGEVAEGAQVEPSVPVPQEPEQVDEPASNSASEQNEDQPKKKRTRVRSMKAGPSVARIVTPVPVPEDERTCAICGGEKAKFGEVEHQRYVFVPARIELHIEQREKLSCEACRKDVSVAPRADIPNVVRKVDASLLAKLVTDKCALCLPLDRQRRELARMGLEIPDKTLQSYWAYTTDLLGPVAIATMASVFAASIVGVDDTHLKTLDKSRKRGTFRGHIWCFVGTDGTVGGRETVAYGYAPSWEATEITEWFSAIDGFIQCDDYAGYSTEIEDEDGRVFVAVPPERRLGCGMHIRSKFHAALLAKDGRAAVPLKIFADLYEVEADCKQRGLDTKARCEERKRRSRPLLDALDRWVDAIHPRLLPKSPLREATNYAINQREFFRRCFDDGRFEIDNGRTERRIRPFAVARRNFLFTGSVRGGERLAIAFTLVDNCLLLGIDPHVYLVDVINKLEADWPLRRISELLPQRWAADQASQQPTE
jgi:transposase